MSRVREKVEIRKSFFKFFFVLRLLFIVLMIKLSYMVKFRVIIKGNGCGRCEKLS